MPMLNDPWLPESDGGGAVPAARPAIVIRVFRVSRDEDGNASDPEELPNVACLAIQQEEGAVPSRAEFRYKFDGDDAEGPQSFEQALSTNLTTEDLPHLVEIGDELAVQATRPDGETEWIFHGNPLAWSLHLDRGTETVAFSAVGIERSLWRECVGGAIYRDGSKLEEADEDVVTGLVPQFNPRGIANATPTTGDSGEDPYTYPVFMDPTRYGTDEDDHEYPRTFDLPMAVAYLMYTNNDGSLVKNMARDDLEALLVAKEPNDGTSFDPADPTTYTVKPFQAPDTPLRGRPWPTLVHDFVKDNGFGMRFPIEADLDGYPRTSIELFLRQGADPKPLLLQERGDALDPALSNLMGADMARDLTPVVNSYVVRGALKRYEASFVLCPGFPSQSADSAETALKAFDKADPAFTTSANHDAYRLWVFDEDGAGCYPNNSVGESGPTVIAEGSPTSLDAVLGEPDDDGTKQYVARARPPRGELITRSPSGVPLRYRLYISTDYAGAYPKVWDGSGTWQHVNDGYYLLKDRIGIYISIDNPNHWTIGKSKVPGHPYPVGLVNAVEAIANPTLPDPPEIQKRPFFLRLTCVIEGDQPLEGYAPRQDTSPLEEEVKREIDASDRLFYFEVAAGSEFNTETEPDVVRDDTDLAKAEAVAARTATDSGVFEGTVHIPRFTTVYKIGDRIQGIEGRDLGFRTDTGGSGFAPILPVVVSRRFTLEGGQHTILTLSDAGLDRRRRAVRLRAPRPVTRSSSRAPAAPTQPDPDRYNA